MRRWTKQILGMVAALTPLIGGGARAEFYQITDLGPGTATSVNASGQAAGFMGVPPHAALYSGGGVIDLGVLPGFERSQASGINAAGQVVGSSTRQVGQQVVTHAFLYSNGVTTDLHTLFGSASSSTATGINAAGQIVGAVFSTPSLPRAFLLSGGTVTDLGVLPGRDRSFANALNASGQVVGYSGTPGVLGDAHAFLYSGGSMRDLGVLPGFSTSVANAINAAGQVVGYASRLEGTDEVRHAFLYSNGVMTDLGVLSGTYSEAFGINTAGQIVGSSFSSPFEPHAVLFNGGTVIDLNSLVLDGAGWTLQYAYGINDDGQIVGTGFFWGQSRAFLLTAVPEPSTLVLTLAGGALLLLGMSGRHCKSARAR
ncbi:MAG: PEP-CTERM sorting domain-containing protein [Isosphaeraceae bacterium]|nr:PEP-CTERM sorting domain-containing protein [Isosphaeraceae bacterium]